MIGFYDDMADMARELLAPEDEGGLGQGDVHLKRVTTTPGPNEWDPPTETVATWELVAAVRRVSTKYVDGTLIVASDNQVTFAVPATVPLMTDHLVIDGRGAGHEGFAATAGGRHGGGLCRVRGGLAFTEETTGQAQKRECYRIHPLCVEKHNSKQQDCCEAEAF